MPAYRLIGGPCSGKTRTYATRPAVGTVITCEQYFYEFGSDGLFHLAALPLGGGGGGQVGGGRAPHAHSGWHSLQRAVNRQLPAAMKETRKLHSATRRKLARLKR